MAKKKKLQSQAPVPLTRGQLSRAERERKQIRNLYTAGIIIGALVVLIVAVAALTTFVVRPNAQVAKVNDRVVKRAEYNMLRRWSLFQQVQNQVFQQQFSQTAVQAPSDLIAQLKRADSEDSLDTSVVSQLQDDEILRQAALKDFSLAPSEDELRTFARKDFIPQPTAPVETPGPATAVVTGTAAVSSPSSTPTMANSPTATPTLAPVPGAEKTAETTYKRYIEAINHGTAADLNSNICRYGCPGLSEQDYLHLIIAPRFLKERITEKLSAGKVITDVEQIHVAHILTNTQEGALKIKDMLDKGADFAQTANVQSSEQITNTLQGRAANGGDLGWTSKEDSQFVAPFTDAAFKVQTGKYSDPIKTQFGWHIIKVLERDLKRPLAEDVLARKRQKLYDDWFANAKKQATLEPAPPTPVVVPTQPAIVEPTSPPASPGAVGTPSPSAGSSGGLPPTATEGSVSRTAVGTLAPVSTPTK